MLLRAPHLHHLPLPAEVGAVLGRAGGAARACLALRRDSGWSAGGKGARKPNGYASDLRSFGAHFEKSTWKFNPKCRSHAPQYELCHLEGSRNKSIPDMECALSYTFTPSPSAPSPPPPSSMLAPRGGSAARCPPAATLNVGVGGPQKVPMHGAGHVRFLHPSK